MNALRSFTRYRPTKVVQVFAGDAEFSELTAAFGYSEFSLVPARDPADAGSFRQAPVAAIVSDALNDPIAACKALSPGFATILLVSEAGFATRLAAARAGVHAIMRRPLDPLELLRCLEEIGTASSRDRLSIVLVDDDGLTADLNAEILKSAGMNVTVVTDPRCAVDEIERVLPDLILMDVNMPEVSGLELARIVRLSRALVAIPIVFLSVEADEERQFAARGIGGDDFISKPVEPRKFIAQVKLRATRARALRSLSERDGLTGLLNHSCFRERLAHELLHSARQQTELNVALIDIDFFKTVNDRYGHAAGDQVLRTLAQILTASLRKTDIIARCGGEEFGIILRGTNDAAAATVIDKLRERFAAMPFQLGVDRIGVTFSAGLSSNMESGTPADLLMAADRSLYAAKAAGRNRVVHAMAKPRDRVAAAS